MKQVFRVIRSFKTEEKTLQLEKVTEWLDMIAMDC
jgi:hypothetical protein